MGNRPGWYSLEAQNEWPHTATDHECRECGFPLGQVTPSRMLVCDNPICNAEPLFLIP